MAETIRDVTIRVSLKTGDVSIKAPELAKLSQQVENLSKKSAQAGAAQKKVADELNAKLAEQKKKYEELVSAAEKRATTVVEAAAKEKETAEEILADIKKRADAIVKAAEEEEKAQNEAKKAAQERAKAERERIQAIREQERAQRDLAAAQKAIVDNNLRAADSFKQAGEGAFTLARGIALISTDSDEDLAEVLKRIAAVQGAFDLFKGSIDTIRGVTEGVRALRAASAASAAANTILAASNTGVAATSTAAAAGMTAFNAALGPAGIALLAIGAAAAGVIAFLGTMDDEAEDAATEVDNLAKATERYRQELEALDKQRQHAGEQARRSAGVPGGISNIEAVEREIAALKKQREETERLLAESESLAALQLTPITKQVDYRRAKLLYGMDGHDSERDVNEQIRRDIEANRAQREHEKERIAQGQQGAVEAQEKLLALAARDFELQQERFRIMERQADTRKDELEAQKRIVEESRAALRIEEDRLRREQSRLGLLSQEDIARVQQLGAVVQGGGRLGRDDLLFLQGVGDEGAQRFVGQEAARRAQEQGLGGLFQPFGGGEDVLRGNVDAARRELEAQIAVEGDTEEIFNKLRALQERQATERQQYATIFDANIAAIDNHAARLAELEERAQRGG